MITIRDLRKRFGEAVVLDDVTAAIERGELVVLLGSNGAGKTTLLRCLIGILDFEGRVEIGGHDVRHDGKAARHLVGYVPQRPSFPPDLTAAEVLDLFARLRGLPGGHPSWLARAGLAAQANALVRTLSGGMKQRLALAVALQADPEVILFDEPAAHLDVAARRALHRDLDGLAKAGRTVVLATHLAADPLQAATRVLILDRGRLAYNGAPAGMGAAVRQRVVFTLNGGGRRDLLAALEGLEDVHVTETPGSVIATTAAGRTFDVLAAVAVAGDHRPAVHLEEPAIDARLLPDAPAVTPRERAS